MSVCCCTGSTTCCCEDVARTYSVELSGLSDNVGTGTGTGTDDSPFGCFLGNRPFCLCLVTCGRYVGGSDLLEGGIDENCIRSYNAFRLVLTFDCDVAEIGTGSGSGTGPTGLVTLAISGTCLYDGSEVLLATYVRSRDSWHCGEDSNTMVLNYTNDECSGWPSEVTLTKNDQSFVCRCTCGHGVEEIGTTINYEVILSTLASGDCAAGDCGCDVPAMRFCMEDLGYCQWSGEMTHYAVALPLASLLEAPPVTYYPMSCGIAFPNDPFYPTGVGSYIAFMFYSAQEDKVVFGWKDFTASGNSSIHLPLDTHPWAAKYSIDAPLFDPFGPNTFTFEEGTYTKCVLPNTAEINYYGSVGSCSQPNFDCDLCTVSGGELPGGWSFSIEGVTGALATKKYSYALGDTQILAAQFPQGPAESRLATCQVMPCDTVNGEYCLSNETGLGTCDWSSCRGVGAYDGFSPEAQFYRGELQGNICANSFTTDFCFECNITNGLSYTYAYMRSSGGVVTLQIVLVSLLVTEITDAQGNLPGDLTTGTADDLILSGYCVGGTSICKKTWNYVIGVDQFDCTGPNDLTLLCDDSLDATGVNNLDSGEWCDCSGMPTTITITPTEACGPPPQGCRCDPKTNYSPRAAITGRDNASCDDCVCIPRIDICFTPSGATTECTWSADFTLDIDVDDFPFTCGRSAVHADLDIGETDPLLVTISIYDGSSNLLALFSAARSGFSCNASAFVMVCIEDNDPDCDWLGATCSLNMRGGPCPTCYPCDPSTLVSPNSFAVNLTYESELYEFCVSDVLGQCSVSSNTLATPSGNIYVIIEFGIVPAEFVRLLVMLDTDTGTGTAEPTLIGVYNYLAPLTEFNCTGDTVFLSAGNIGECGWDVDVSGYTENLLSTATIFQDTCVETCSACSVDSSSPGVSSFPTTAGCTYFFETWGAGGAGHSGSTGNRSAGGGGGGYSSTTWVSDGSTLTITVGAAGVITGNDGTAGGDTSIGAVCIAKGGGGTGSDGTTAGIGGQASAGTGDTKFSGGNGGNGAADDQGGGGGGSASPSGNGNNGQDGDDGLGIIPAAGGAALTDGGAGGAGGLLISAGSPGTSPGGGGGGGDQNTGTAGANGAAGRYRITCIVA